jgi:pimeloyl-ACP methyl ester carboxylesterase
MAEQTCKVGEIEIAYETFGDPANPAVLLVMGLATQMIAWHEDFCAELASRGFHVIRFDNRDVGRSTALRHLPAPTIRQLALRSKKAAGYTLSDMAGDAVGLLDRLGIERAHVVGASMGGMIAQVLAGRNPTRVRSLGLIMTSSGRPMSSIPKWRVIRLAFDAPRKDAPAEDRLANEVRNISIINGPNFLPPVDQLRRRVEELAARSDYREGMLRQFDAILGTGSLMRYTRRITAPTVVLHGSQDPMVRPRNGRNVARAIDGARYVVVDGMGHDLPEPLWRPIVEALTENMASS